MLISISAGISKVFLLSGKGSRPKNLHLLTQLTQILTFKRLQLVNI